MGFVVEELGVEVRGVCARPEDLGRSGMPNSSRRSSPGVSWVGLGASLALVLPSSMPSKRASRSSFARRSFLDILLVGVGAG